MRTTPCSDLDETVIGLATLFDVVRHCCKVLWRLMKEKAVNT